MEDINALVAIGKGMGLTGTELSTFVDKREAMIREAERGCDSERCLVIRASNLLLI